MRQQHYLPVQLLHCGLTGSQHQIELTLNGLLSREKKAPLRPHELFRAMAHRAIRRGCDGEHHTNAVIRFQQRENVHQPNTGNHKRHDHQNGSAPRTEHSAVRA
ncbi:hypothetical protein [Streptomyces sp. NEAU-YJ-81]|uniref:hypothetical protein n=1 Tax=Streptomyces sp. NEAU-YJ-81 TaxID=2820288 RepID=UPI001ABC2A2C|nr:hypothetical protein [Streptomyces sp. NEAU-YJ-81]MBO3681725.1 hypothetical protein [Streptomyces sp. NEAU-YJ-81]